MIKNIFKQAKPYISKKRKTHISVTALREKDFDSWLKKQRSVVKTQVKNENFSPSGTTIFVVHNERGKVKEIIGGVHDKLQLYDFARVARAIQQRFSEDFLKETSFEIKGLRGHDLNKAYIGWGLAAYEFSTYKKPFKSAPALLWSGDVDKNHVNAMIESIFGVRSLVNLPANDLGPEELEKVANALADDFKAKIKVVKGQVLEKEFPMINAVGDSSPRRPRLIDLNWGNAKHPKLTIVGKGVCFDTGGLDIKPSQHMRLMKKDMGGAAHAMALGRLVMAHKLPVCLRILVPAVENSVSGQAFRPGDIFTSRKGLTIENTNTDAEGRLILSDTLTLASEEAPDLIIDFATLTGSARAALGPDVPPFFSNNEKIAQDLRKVSEDVEDSVWPMPLVQGYNKLIESPIADLINSAGAPGDLIYSALFLEKFLIGKPDWIHLDIFAWENTGRAGRPKGGADTGLRATFAYLQKRYGS